MDESKEQSSSPEHLWVIRISFAIFAYVIPVAAFILTKIYDISDLSLNNLFWLYLVLMGPFTIMFGIAIYAHIWLKDASRLNFFRAFEWYAEKLPAWLRTTNAVSGAISVHSLIVLILQPDAPAILLTQLTFGMSFAVFISSTFTLMARWSSMNDFQQVHKKLDEILDALTDKVDDDNINKKTNKLDEILDALTDKVDDDNINKKTNKLDTIIDILTCEEDVNGVKKQTTITDVLIEIKNILASKK